MAYPPSVPPTNRINSTPQADNHPGDHNQISSALSDIINEVSTKRLKNDGSIPSTLLRLTNTNDVTLTSTTHAFQIGPSTGVNLAADSNEIQARNNGAISPLSLQAAGGGVSFGGTLSSVGGYTTGNPDPAAQAGGAVLDNTGLITSVVRDLQTANLSLTRCISPASDAGQQFIRFGRLFSDTGVGSITIASSTSVAYNTTSDPRLKESLGPIDDAAARVQALGARAFRGRWIADEGEGQEWDFLSSVDIDAVAGYAVTGTEGATDADGGIVPQQVDYSSLVPLLVAALADALDRIETLENR